MPRDGSGVYTLPFPDVVTNTTIASTVYNGFEHDVATDLNAPRPVVAGGTGATSATAALAALKGETFGQVVTNYDSFVFLPGSFYSDAAATSPPVAGHAFVGICSYVDANNMYLEAYDRDDATQPGAVYFRQKKAGVWSAWAKAQALNVVGTPVANQFTTWQSSTALQGVALTGLVKGNGASAPTAAVASTDYVAATSGSAVQKANGSGGLTAAVAGTDFTGAPANPTATIGLAAVNGSANTGMRSDAAPALSQAIVPTWSGLHTFSVSPVVPTPTAGDNSTKAATTAFVLANSASLGRSYLAGLTLSTAGSSATFSVAAGSADDSTNSNIMQLGSALSKTTAAWAVGTGNGGLDTGAIANSTTYHAHLIKRTDTGVVDVLVSLSATAPTLPASYTLFRRIGSMRTNASAQWTSFIQDGNDFYLSTPVTEVSVSNPGTVAVTRTLNSIPTGLRVKAYLAVGVQQSVNAPGSVNTPYLYLSDLSLPDLAASATNMTAIAFATASATVNINIVNVTQAMVWLNTSSQMRSRLNFSDANTSIFISALGWMDTRGRDA